ncbi:MAG: hypothetical protein CMP76_10020 [Flavobacterium sp.]|uniref:DUF4421 family protein n=1 Tax=Flavobacterium sp. TaxID=239 RepID=UPI000C4E80AF|nr:DUF4421 family protein [Flavobacterium sp.]MBF03620.1 hypothetical protein [Flavobacterium sp.]
MAQEKKAIDSTYIKTFPEKVSVRINVDTQEDLFSLNDTEDNKKLTLQSNTTFRLFISLDYKFIGGSIGFAPKFISDNNDEFLKGKSSYTNYKFRFFLGKWVQGIEFSKVRGFYVENSQDYIANWTENKDPYIQFPDLKYLTIGLNTSYVFNPKFSYRNILFQSEWQQKSAGSFIPTLYYDYNRTSLQLESTKIAEDFFNIRLALGYYYTLVIQKKGFVSAYLAPAYGIRFSKNTNTSQNETTISKDTYSTQYLDGGLQLGYSSDHFIFGTHLNFSANAYKEEGSKTISQGKSYLLFYVGYRFNPPKAVARLVDKISLKKKNDP